MRDLFLRVKTRFSRYQGELLSVAAHSVVLACLFSGVHLSPRVVPYKLPGTSLGTTMLTFYAPGSAHPVTSNSPVKTLKKPKPTSQVHPVPSLQQVEQSKAVESTVGVGTSAESGLGEGDITIALQSYFPYPKPDLSTLPHGTKGDIILNAVIDKDGKISELKLLKGLGSPVDETVIATVQQWRYTPAMRNGIPVASEQELHFHYERG